MGSAGDAAVPGGRTQIRREGFCLSPWVFSQLDFLTFPLELCGDGWGGPGAVVPLREHPGAPAGGFGQCQASVGLCPHLAMALPCLALLQLRGLGFHAMGKAELDLCPHLPAPNPARREGERERGKRIPGTSAPKSEETPGADGEQAGCHQL